MYEILLLICPNFYPMLIFYAEFFEFYSDGDGVMIMWYFMFVFIESRLSAGS